jgi:hypothetical protein
MASLNFSRVSQYLSLLVVVFGGRNSHSRRPSQSQNMVATVFFAYGLCERGDEPPGSIKCREVLE